MVFGDAWASLHEQAAALRTRRRRRCARAPTWAPRTGSRSAGSCTRDLAANQPGGGLLGTVMALEDDVVAYVCRNDLREGIRGFIREAVRRLLAREDVLGVVVNAHSQGTVASFDVLQQSPPGRAPRSGRW